MTHHETILNIASKERAVNEMNTLYEIFCLCPSPLPAWVCQKLDKELSAGDIKSLDTLGQRFAELADAEQRGVGKLFRDIQKI